MSEHTPDPHPDERLARLLGDTEPGDDALAGDPAVQRLLDAVGDIGPDDALEAPPPGLWDAIAAGAGLAEAADEGTDLDLAVAGSDDWSTGAALTPAEAARRLRRPTPPPTWMAAAAAVLVVLAIAVGVFSIASIGDDEPTTEQVAAADLDVLDPTWVDLGASATLVRHGDDMLLELDVDGLREIDGYFEVWLLTPEVDGLVSLGPLRADGRYQVPDGLDSRFSVVDVSIEPHDGDPTHSGNSILRGGLTEA